jgi:cell division protein FtsZ
LLEDDMEDKVSLDHLAAKTILSPEEQQKRTQDRLAKIQEYTTKLKKAEGIAEFENEHAFVRRIFHIYQTSPSTENNVSRFGLSDDASGSGLRNNNFLHDNVD